MQKEERIFAEDPFRLPLPRLSQPLLPNLYPLTYHHEPGTEGSYGRPQGHAPRLYAGRISLTSREDGTIFWPWLPVLGHLRVLLTHPVTQRCYTYLPQERLIRSAFLNEYTTILQDVSPFQNILEQSRLRLQLSRGRRSGDAQRERHQRKGENFLYCKCFFLDYCYCLCYTIRMVVHIFKIQIPFKFF